MTAKQGFVLHHPQLCNTDLTKLLIKLIPGTQTAWYLVTAITETDFDTFIKPVTEEFVSMWPQGRVFWNEGEIRWKRSPGQEYNDVLILTEEPDLHLEGFREIGYKWQVFSPGEQASLRVWGNIIRESPHLRTESRLPRPISYPGECLQEGSLIFLYYCTPHGEVQFLRLKGVR